MLHNTDAILALNSGTDELGDLTRDTKARVDAAMQLASSHPGAQVVMVGHGSEGMRDYAAEHYQEPEPVVEGRSLDTIESAHFTKLDYIEPNAWRRITVATSDYHILRAGWAFSRILGEGYEVTMHPVASDHSPERLRWIQRRERAQLTVARLKLLGIRPADDDQRERRLSRLRFRGEETPLARLLIAADHLTQPKRD